MFAFTRTACPGHLTGCWEELGLSYETAKAEDPAFKFQWTASFRYKDTRRLLSEMTHGHCAFCDGGDLGAMSCETIEHFRPKSRPEFRRFAYQWENLYPCCDQCQSQKLEKFDEKLLVADEIGYCFDDYFIVDYATGELQVNPLSTVQKQLRAEVTLELYGLNIEIRKQCRKKELRRFQRRDPDVEVIDDFSYRYFLMDA